MKHKIISYSFVGVWKSPLGQVPNFDRKFCLDLFQDPYNTHMGISPEGFFITKQVGSPPFSSVLINPQRIQVTGFEIFEVIVTYDKVIQEIVKATSGAVPLFFDSVGLNTEHEWTEMNESGDKWLTDKFIEKGLSKGNFQYYTKTYDIRFELVGHDDRKFNILLQPRAQNQNAIFGAINDHRIWTSFACPDAKAVEELFDDSLNELENKIFKIFLD
ncbi:MAG: hypothetical protein K8R21_00815 [Leptospira sp.]|nr:hypothetical protein [Leptospira sp.]